MYSLFSSVAVKNRTLNFYYVSNSSVNTNILVDVYVDACVCQITNLANLKGWKNASAWINVTICVKPSGAAFVL